MNANLIATIELHEVTLTIFAGIAAVPLLFFVHGLLNRICFAHVKRYCRSHDIQATGWRLFPAFDERGTKTENTQIEVLATGPEGQKAYRFIVWVFGIRTVTQASINPNPEEN